ncbi:hypothetical protein PISMIDRAFT_155748 [Pisolithus microcarpus 441]|uniref:Uncharacterized protein n=1 Tax=Pisolithus microcarpus 441 TaxID=765257 RepID=A0A0C9YRP5_9AGAM|nr:hypothetical protein PISMIDRAFT_155748 [Pisolithus microcarpus 441]
MPVARDVRLLMIPGQVEYRSSSAAADLECCWLASGLVRKLTGTDFSRISQASSRSAHFLWVCLGSHDQNQGTRGCGMDQRKQKPRHWYPRCDKLQKPAKPV